MKILVIEDNPADVKLIRNHLSDNHASSFEIIQTDRLLTALQFLSEGNFDIILLDLGLPDSQGLDTVKSVRNHAYGVPIVVLTGFNSEEMGILALKEGAQDYLIKSHMDRDSLKRSIRYAIERNLIEQELMQSRDHLKDLLKEKEVLLKEIHHRVKNNLQVISSLLFLQSQTVKDESTRVLFRESQNRIRMISLVHEQLYRSDNLSQIEYGEYLNKMFSSLFESYNADKRRISMKIDVNNVMITIEKAVPCSLIVNELFSNSLKHAFPNDAGGEIRIGFVLDNISENYILDYQDSGVGIPQEIVLEETKSMGMTLIFGLTRQLKGTVVHEQEQGVHFTISFPAKDLIGG